RRRNLFLFFGRLRSGVTRMNKKKLIGLRLPSETLLVLKKDFGSVQEALRYLITNYLLTKKGINP
ncbi:hypothetical protein RZS08_26360, partial [Arthrospira platensis SPKY1]|nr:hypothetical protein [Arthrospira platensis SPKY1]